MFTKLFVVVQNFLKDPFNNDIYKRLTTSNVLLCNKLNCMCSCGICWGWAAREEMVASF